MSDITMRSLQIEETAEVAIQLSGYAFSPTPPLPTKEEQLKYLEYQQDSTAVALFEDDKPMVITRSTPLRHNVRGAILSGGGIRGVATHPSGRRKGYARQALTKLLHELHERGEVMSTLYPFRESFYQRLGYATFPQPRTVKFSPAPLGPLLKQPLEGEVSLKLLSEGNDEWYLFMEKILQQQHGLGLFSQRASESRRDHNPTWLAIAQVNGEAHGMMHYKIKGYDNSMEVSRFFYTSSQGKYLLLEWFARHIDQIKTIEIVLSPDEQPETWFADLIPTIQTELAPMGRVLDVTGLNGLATGAGHLHISINDPVCPWNEGTYRLDSENGKLQVARGNASPDCHLTIQGLTALVYGTHDPETFAIRGWGELSPEIQERLRQMFPAKRPYLQETF